MLAEHFLPTSYKNSKNAFGQSVCLMLQQPAPGQIDALLISTGGTAIPDKELGYIAANAGTGGGLIKTASSATGAYGGWSAPLATWRTDNCNGVPGHLANQLFMYGPGNQDADFLYRSIVPGHPELNAMKTPIGLPIAGIGAPCINAVTGATSVATDPTNHMLTCVGNTWTATSWREPVANIGELSGATALQGALPGETRITLDSMLPYVWNGSQWAPAAVDNNGALNLPKAVAAGTPCGLDVNGTAQPNANQIGVDSTGLVMTCVNNQWQSANVIVPGPQDHGCRVIMAPAGPTTDYPPATCAPFDPTLPVSHNQLDGTASASISRPLQITQAALITVSTFAHMNYSQCNLTGWDGQLSQTVDIFSDDAPSTPLAHTESQTPQLHDDSAGLNLSLIKAVPKGSYHIRVTTNWATYAGNFGNVGSGQPWTSSFCGTGNSLIINTPIAAGWTIDSAY
jgi:hypothetical protein